MMDAMYKLNERFDHMEGRIEYVSSLRYGSWFLLRFLM